MGTGKEIDNSITKEVTGMIEKMELVPIHTPIDGVMVFEISVIGEKKTSEIREELKKQAQEGIIVLPYGVKMVGTYKMEKE